MQTQTASFCEFLSLKRSRSSCTLLSSAETDVVAAHRPQPPETCPKASYTSTPARHPYTIPAKFTSTTQAMTPRLSRPGLKGKTTDQCTDDSMNNFTARLSQLDAKYKLKWPVWRHHEVAWTIYAGKYKIGYRVLGGEDLLDEACIPFCRRRQVQSIPDATVGRHV